MQIRPRSLLPALALAALAFASASAAPPALSSGPARPGNPSAAVGRKPTPHLRRRAARKPLGARAAAIALRAVGVPYRWGGTSPTSGFDCSGLVYWAYGRLGVELPHSSYALFALGRPVARGRLKPGDVLFFSGLGHVGLYVGRGRMVHAPQSGRSVEIVRLDGYGGRFVSARRVVAA